MSGEFLFGCRSSAVGQFLQLDEKEGVFHCILPKNPLKEGQYFYNVIAFDKGKILDYVRDAGQIKVSRGDYYGTGKIPAAGRAGVCVDFHWQ